MSDSVRIDQPQPSQLYVDDARVRNALDWFDPDDPTYDLIPVLHIEGEIVLSDGHIRAFLAYLSGAESLEDAGIQTEPNPTEFAAVPGTRQVVSKRRRPWRVGPRGSARES